MMDAHGRPTIPRYTMWLQVYSAFTLRTWCSWEEGTRATDHDSLHIRNTVHDVFYGHLQCIAQLGRRPTGARPWLLYTSGAPCLLNDAKCSLNNAKCSLNHAECSLNDVKCSLNDIERSICITTNVSADGVCWDRGWIRLMTGNTWLVRGLMVDILPSETNSQETGLGSVAVENDLLGCSLRG
jgi:hypothetical protein